MDKGVIEDYDHTTTMDECKLDETNTYYQFILWSVGPPFVQLPLFWINNKTALLDAYTRENEYLSLMYTMYTSAQLIPLLTFRLVRTWYEESTH